MHCLFFVLYSICLTKMDILDTFDEIKIGVCYKLDGKVLDSMPGQHNQQVIYRLTESSCTVVMYLIFPILMHTLSLSPPPPTHTATQALLEKVEVEYVSMPGWKTSLAHMKSLEELPPNARAYVSRLSELTGMKGK